jgi:hypothetical protein
MEEAKPSSDTLSTPSKDQDLPALRSSKSTT